MIKTGQTAPLDIEVMDATGSPISLRTFLGSYVVLYTYPKDETPGCIKEACSIRDVYEEFKTLGVTVIGVSPDDETSHKNFAEHHHLQFPLWADTKHELLAALGVWREQSSMGKTFMGVSRTTFLIDKEGNIVHIWENVNPEGHGEAVVDYVSKLIKTSNE